MILCTVDDVPGHRVIEICGLAKGCSVRGLHMGDDLMARMKNTVGGEVHEYTQVFAQCREQALDRMVTDGKRLGANAIIGIRFQSAEIGVNMAEMMAYGTAVIVESIDSS